MNQVEQVLEAIYNGHGEAAERFNEYAAGEAMAAFLETDRGAAFARAWAEQQVEEAKEAA
ncbi:hypothetical protein GCM10027040_27300 [Halomonas shantousis]